MTTFNFRLIVLSLFTLSLVFISCSKDEEEVIVMMEEEIDGSCPYAQLFHEKDGLVRVDIENWNLSICLAIKNRYRNKQY